MAGVISVWSNEKSQQVWALSDLSDWALIDYLTALTLVI